jgi:hypothetical protein
MLYDPQVGKINEPCSSTIYEFNILLSRYTHISWYKTLPYGRVLSKLRTCQRVEKRVSPYLLTSFGLTGQYWYNFKETIPRIALWNPSELQCLIFYTGLAIHSGYLRRVVMKDEVLMLRDQIGDQAYKFAINQTDQILPKAMLNETQLDIREIRETALISGMRCFGTVFGSYPLGLHKRLMLKLPHDWLSHFLHPLRKSRIQSTELLENLFLNFTGCGDENV